jgi:predicted HAD superfamily phosphohydrolase YqeG
MLIKITIMMRIKKLKIIVLKNTKRHQINTIARKKNVKELTSAIKPI